MYPLVQTGCTPDARPIAYLTGVPRSFHEHGIGRYAGSRSGRPLAAIWTGGGAQRCGVPRIGCGGSDRGNPNRPHLPGSKAAHPDLRVSRCCFFPPTDGKKIAGPHGFKCVVQHPRVRRNVFGILIEKCVP